MERHHRRDRHVVSHRTISILRVFGWRYSMGRDAWVHRVGDGKIGPVFHERGAPLFRTPRRTTEEASGEYPVPPSEKAARVDPHSAALPPSSAPDRVRPFTLPARRAEQAAEEAAEHVLQDATDVQDATPRTADESSLR